jgi:hypothetical protein
MMRKTGWLIGLLMFVIALPAAMAQDVPGLYQGGAGPQPMGQQAGLYSNSNRLSYGNPFGMIPKFSPEMFNAINGTRLKTGTILTGVLEDKLSSKSSKAGDLFSIYLQDGYEVGGRYLIPKQARILGSVTAAHSSQGRRNGEPGSIDVALQTLVFPDGRHMPFVGTIDHNPAQDPKHKPGSQPVDFLGTGKRTLTSAMTLVTGRIGYPIRMGSPGHEFKLDKGEALPIKVGQPLDLTLMGPPPLVAPQGQAGPLMGAAPVPGMAAPAAMSLNDMPPTAPPPGMVPQTAPSISSGVMTPSQMPDPF